MANQKPKPDYYLTVAQDFDNYKKGDQITDQQKIANVLQTHADFVIKTALRGKN